MSDPTVHPANAEELFDPEAKKPDSTDAILDTPVKTNDPKALKKKALSDKAREFQDEADLRWVLSQPAGVRFLARLIAGPCGWNQPYYQPSNSAMCEVAGRRSIGWQLEQWISDADLSLWSAVRKELEAHRVKPKTSEKRQA